MKRSLTERELKCFSFIHGLKQNAHVNNTDAIAFMQHKFSMTQEEAQEMFWLWSQNVQPKNDYECVQIEE